GKPLPASAVHGVLPRLASARMDASRQVQWLVDTPERLAEYRALARAQGVPLGVNIEIDVGLHRGGVESTEMLAAMLDLLRDEPLLPLRGFMGY
ncbi:DSD1 family PLP-dependent enzyme, partial [Citrobacter sp. AAK_AS5]